MLLPANLVELWKSAWGKPLQLSQVEWKGSQYDFFEPGKQVGQLFIARLEERILVREEYRVAYDYFEANASYKPAIGRSACYILTGSPGIGKTCFLAYAVLRRLSEEKPTSIQLDATHYAVFTKGGAGVFGYDFEHAVIPDGSWALSDTTRNIHEPCQAFFASPAVIIHAAPPDSERWEHWKTEQRAKLYAMDIWNEIELGALLAVLELNIASGLSFADWYGPCARTMVLLASDADEERYYLERLNKALENFNKSPSQRLAEARELRISDNALSYMVLHIRPSTARRRGTIEVALPISALLKRVSMGLDFIAELAKHPYTRVAVDWMIESYTHAHCLYHMSLGLTPFSRSQGGMDYNNQTIFYGEAGRSSSFGSRPVSKITGAFDEDPSWNDFFWRPKKGYLPGVDGAILAQGRLIAIQFTIDGARRAPDAGLDKLMEVLRTKRFHGKIEHKSMAYLDIDRTRNLSLDSRLTAVEGENPQGFVTYSCSIAPFTWNSHISEAWKDMDEAAPPSLSVSPLLNSDPDLTR